MGFFACGSPDHKKLILCRISLKSFSSLFLYSWAGLGFFFSKSFEKKDSFFGKGAGFLFSTFLPTDGFLLRCSLILAFFTLFFAILNIIKFYKYKFIYTRGQNIYMVVVRS